MTHNVISLLYCWVYGLVVVEYDVLGAGVVGSGVVFTGDADVVVVFHAGPGVDVAVFDGAVG